MIDTLNADASGGKPTFVERQLGRLAIPSHTLLLADPQYVTIPLLVPNWPCNEVVISAGLWQYPEGNARVASLHLAADGFTSGNRRKIGEVPIDSAKLVVADKADIDAHWTEVGKDRIGIISTPKDDEALQLLTKRFRLETIQTEVFHAEVVGPVSESLEKEIEAFLQTIPRFAQFPFFHFRVRTNNSFERSLLFETAWMFLPIGNEALPLMFGCETGRGDGTYEVYGEFVGDVPVAVAISFIEDEGED